MPKDKIVYRLASRKDRLQLHHINNVCLPVVYTENDWVDIISMKHTYIITVGAIAVAYCACDKNGCIMSFAVLEKYRQKGFGKKLLLYCIDDMKKNKIKKLCLRVKISNTIAQKLYTSVGFTISQTLDKYYSDSESAYFMEYILLS